MDFSYNNKIQKEAYGVWESNGYFGTVCLFTGAGKTKLGIDCINNLQDRIDNVLILVPSINLKDDEWKTELAKWRTNDIILSKANSIRTIIIECIQTAYKWENKNFDLVIVDEIHRSLSDEYGNIHNIQCKYKLGLTATPPYHDEEKMKKLDEVCPIIYKKTVIEGVSEGAAKKFVIANVAIGMSKSDWGKYRLWDNKFNKSRLNLAKEINRLRLNGDKCPDNTFEAAKEWRKDKDHARYEDSVMYWVSMQKRKSVLYNAGSKINATKRLCEKAKDKKILIFCKTIDLAILIQKALGDKARIYHSKQKKVEREITLKLFKEDKFRILVSVDALGVGFNLPIVDMGISAAGTSVILDFIQRLGRIIRPSEKSNTALFVNLFIPGTQEEKWVNSKLKEFMESGNIKIINTKLEKVCQ